MAERQPTSTNVDYMSAERGLVSTSSADLVWRVIFQLRQDSTASRRSGDARVAAPPSDAEPHAQRLRAPGRPGGTKSSRQTHENDEHRGSPTGTDRHATSAQASALLAVVWGAAGRWRDCTDDWSRGISTSLSTLRRCKFAVRPGRLRLGPRVASRAAQAFVERPGWS